MAAVLVSSTPTYKNVGRAPLAETLLQSSLSSFTHPFVKKGFVAQSSSDTATNYALNVIRPFYKYVE